MKNNEILAEQVRVARGLNGRRELTVHCRMQCTPCYCFPALLQQPCTCCLEPKDGSVCDQNVFVGTGMHCTRLAALFARFIPSE